MNVVGGGVTPMPNARTRCTPGSAAPIISGSKMSNSSFTQRIQFCAETVTKALDAPGMRNGNAARAVMSRTLKKSAFWMKEPCL